MMMRRIIENSHGHTLKGQKILQVSKISCEACSLGIVRYNARLVTQGFSQRPEIDYEETYSLIMDAIMFRYLISLAVSKNFEMRLIDVVTVYLYGSLDSDIYMKIPEGFKMPKASSSKSK